MGGAGLACGLLALLVQAPLLAVVVGGQPHQPCSVQVGGTLADQQQRALAGRALLAEQQAAGQVALEQQQQPAAGAGAAGAKGAEVGGAASAAAAAAAAAGGGAGSTGGARGGVAAAVQQAAEGAQQQQPAAAAAKAADGGGATAAAADAGGGGGVAAAQAAAGAASAGAAAAEAAAAGGARQDGSAAGADQDSVPEPYTMAVPQQGPEAYVAICAAVKDQHIDVREWIFYHRAIGINKFYLTDTGSKPPMQGVLEDYIASGLVEYTFDTKVPPRKGTHGPQVTIYERCLRNHGHRHTWMAFIDVDEFLMLRDGTPDMPALLRDYEQYGGLAVNWIMFGSSGLKKRPAGNTLMSYWKCAPDQHPENCHVKSIVRPPHVNDSTTDPHHFKYNKPLTAVNTRREPVKGPKSQNATLDRVALYHYSIKSLEDFEKKMARGSGMGNQKTIAYLHYIDNFTTADCLDAIDVGVQMAGFAVY